MSAGSGSAARVVIAGGGVAGLEALLALRRAVAGLVDLTLIAPEPEFTYRPLAVLEPFAPGSMPTLSIADFAAEHDVPLVADALVSVRPGERVAITRDGTRMPYDELVVAVGAQPQPVIPGAIALGSPADVPALTQLVEAVRTGACVASRSSSPRESPGRCRSTSWRCNWAWSATPTDVRRAWSS